MKGKITNKGYVTPLVKIVYPNLAKKGEYKGKDQGYNAKFCFDKDKTDLKLLKSKIDEVGQKKWGDDWNAIKQKRDFKHPIYDGDIEKVGNIYFSNCRYISARSRQTRPSVFNSQNRLLELEEIAEISSGAMVEALLSFWGYDNEGIGISCNLHSVRVISAAVPEQIDPEDVFGDAIEDVEDEDGGDIPF